MVTLARIHENAANPFADAVEAIAVNIPVDHADHEALASRTHTEVLGDHEWAHRLDDGGFAHDADADLRVHRAAGREVHDVLAVTEAGHAPVRVEARMAVEHAFGVREDVFGDRCPSCVAGRIDASGQGGAVAARVSLEIVGGHVQAVAACGGDEVGIEGKRGARRIAGELRCQLVDVQLKIGIRGQNVSVGGRPQTQPFRRRVGTCPIDELEDVLLFGGRVAVTVRGCARGEEVRPARRVDRLADGERRRVERGSLRRQREIRERRHGAAEQQRTAGQKPDQTTHIDTVHAALRRECEHAGCCTWPKS